MLAAGWAPNSLDALADYAQLLGLVGLVAAVLALRHSSSQLRQSASAAQGQLILALDEALEKHAEARRKVRRKGWDGPTSSSERNELRRYLAVFERIGILVRDGLLSLELADQLYGDRFAKLVRHDTVQRLVDGREYKRDHNSVAQEWRDLIWLAERLNERWGTEEPNAKLLPCAPESKHLKPGPAVDSDDTFEPAHADQA